MDYKSLSWNELKTLASNNGVYKREMNKGEVIQALMQLEVQVKEELKPEPVVEEPEEVEDVVVFSSVDGRTLEAYINKKEWIGKIIKVEPEYADEVYRLLKDGGFYFTRTERGRIDG